MRFIGYMNKAHLIGTLEGPIAFSHAVFDQRFYTVTIVTKRKSGAKDYIPLTISEKVKTEMEQMTRVDVVGTVRCYNIQKNEKSHMGMAVLVQNCMSAKEETADVNDVCLFGSIYKEPKFKERQTRQLTQFPLSVPRDSKHPDVIPCMAWNQNAAFVVQLPVNTQVKVNGRIQSRLIKRKSETTYEVSVNNLEVYDTQVSA